MLYTLFDTFPKSNAIRFFLTNYLPEKVICYPIWYITFVLLCKMTLNTLSHNYLYKP